MEPFVDLEALGWHVTMKTNSHFMIAEVTQTSLSPSHTASFSKITPAPQGRCPLHHRGRKTLWARHITVAVMCCAAGWMNQIAPMDDGIISLRGLWKVMFKLVPVRFKATLGYMDNDWWRPSLKNTNHKTTTRWPVKPSRLWKLKRKLDSNILRNDGKGAHFFLQTVRYGVCRKG